jgi:hypothetical protein
VAEGPCKNRACKSYGTAHPNCMCYGLARGGGVCDQEMAHQPGCQYFAEGGQVSGAPLEDGSGDQPNVTVEHVALDHGLSKILGGSIGRPKLAEPEKHKRTLEDAKRMHKHKSMGPSADGLEEPGPEKSLGTSLGESIHGGRHHESAENVHGSPLVGSASKSHLAPILSRLSKPLLDHPSDPEGFRSAVDYLHSSAKGADKLEKENLFEKGGHEPDKKSREALKKQLLDLETNPESLFDSGGKLGHYLPDHAVALGAHLANTLNYLKSVKPMPPNGAPLDNRVPPDKIKEDAYNRTLDIVENPNLAIEHVRNGTLKPHDVLTMKTVYPILHQKIVEKIQGQVAEAHIKGVEIPYKLRQAMSIYLEQPLDSTMTPDSMQAIISSSRAPQPPQGSVKGKKSGPTQEGLKIIAKNDALSADPIDRRQMKQRQ